MIPSALVPVEWREVRRLMDEEGWRAKDVLVHLRRTLPMGRDLGALTVAALYGQRYRRWPIARRLDVADVVRTRQRQRGEEKPTAVPEADAPAPPAPLVFVTPRCENPRCGVLLRGRLVCGLCGWKHGAARPDVTDAGKLIRPDLRSGGWGRFVAEKEGVPA